jgi:hypothetical protein
VQSESEESTQLGLVWNAVIVKETEDPGEVGKMPLKMVESLVVENATLVPVPQRDDGCIANGGSDNGKRIRMVAASPNLAEFETFLESLGVESVALLPGAERGTCGIATSGCDKGKGITTVAASPKQGRKTKKKKAHPKKKVITKAKNMGDSDESEDLETFGDIRLRALSHRQSVTSGSCIGQPVPLQPPAADDHSVTEDILFVERSKDDDVPIGITLPSPQPKRKERSKAQVKWTYETVLEPTGVASKYWDADAPAERATKRIAKEKLVALTAAEAENNPKGMSTCCTMTLDLAVNCLNNYSFINC